MSIAEEHTSFTYLFVGGKETQTLTSSVVGLDCDRVGFSGRLGLVSENPLPTKYVSLNNPYEIHACIPAEQWCHSPCRSR